MRLLAALFLLLSVFGGHAAALERAASKAMPMIAVANMNVAIQTQPETAGTAAVISFPGDTITILSAGHAPCKASADCQFLVPVFHMSSSTPVVQTSRTAEPDNCPHHIWKLLRPPIG